MSRRTALLALVGAAASLVGPAPAWACTGTPGFRPLAVQSAPAGTAVTVSGQTAAAGPVTIRWDTLDGLVLASAFAGGESNAFSTSLTIPATTPGVHLLILIQADKPVARATFEVSAPGAPVMLRPNPSRTKDRASDGAARRNAGVLSGGLLAVAALGLLAVSRRRAVPLA